MELLLVWWSKKLEEKKPFPDSLEISIDHWMTTKNRLSDKKLDELYPITIDDLDPTPDRDVEPIKEAGEDELPW